jgi:hypothetical protein
MQPSQRTDIIYSHNLISPSQPHVAIQLGRSGCQIAPMHGPPSCAWNFLKGLVVFQSHTFSFPCPSPLIRNFMLGLKPTWQAYPELLCPLKSFLRSCLTLSPHWYTTTVLSMLCPAKWVLSGLTVMEGTLCMPGSAMYLMGTGMSYSHTWSVFE